MIYLLAITLLWNANSEPDIAGYRVYQGGASGVYTNVWLVGNVVSTPLDLAPGKYFFAVSAVNAAGLESDLSNEHVREVFAAPQVTASRFLAIGLSWPVASGAVY